jgi:hypothetical protein
LRGKKTAKRGRPGDAASLRETGRARIPRGFPAFMPAGSADSRRRRPALSGDVGKNFGAANRF